MRQIIVPINELQMLAEICAELTRQGIAFVAKLNGKEWHIDLTGF